MDEGRAREERRRRILARAHLSEEQLSSALMSGSVSAVLTQRTEVPAPPPAAPPLPRPSAAKVVDQGQLRRRRTLLFAALGVLCALFGPLIARVNLVVCFLLLEGALLLWTRSPGTPRLPTSGLEGILSAGRAAVHALEAFDDFACFFVCFVVARSLWLLPLGC